MKYKESDLENYASPIGKTEDEKCRHAIEMVRDALTPAGYQPDGDIEQGESDTNNLVLNMSRSEWQKPKKKIKILVQGSYANKTNVPSESDVDVAIVLESSFGMFFKNGSVIEYQHTNQDIVDALTLKRFKGEVEQLLRKKFPLGVTRHNKSIHVRGNTYRVDADVVPCGRYEGRVYLGGKWWSVSGVRIQPDTGTAIINYPEYHIRNGVRRNTESSFAFKKLIRIMKRIRSDMENHGWRSAGNVSSFAIESMLWNVPLAEYTQYPTVLWYTFKKAIEWLYLHRLHISSFVEINGIKNFDEDDSLRSRKCSQFLESLHQHYECEI